MLNQSDRTAHEHTDQHQPLPTVFSLCSAREAAYGAAGYILNNRKKAPHLQYVASWRGMCMQVMLARTMLKTKDHVMKPWLTRNVTLQSKDVICQFAGLCCRPEGFVTLARIAVRLLTKFPYVTYSSCCPMTSTDCRESNCAADNETPEQ